MLSLNVKHMYIVGERATCMSWTMQSSTMPKR